jgi:hypothetical protein
MVLNNESIEFNIGYGFNGITKKTFLKLAFDKKKIYVKMRFKFKGDKNTQAIQNAALASNFHESFQALESKYQTGCHLLQEEILFKVQNNKLSSLSDLIFFYQEKIF